MKFAICIMYSVYPRISLAQNPPFPSNPLTSLPPNYLPPIPPSLALYIFIFFHFVCKYYPVKSVYERLREGRLGRNIRLGDIKEEQELQEVWKFPIVISWNIGARNLERRFFFISKYLVWIWKPELQEVWKKIFFYFYIVCYTISSSGYTIFQMGYAILVPGF